MIRAISLPASEGLLECGSIPHAVGQWPAAGAAGGADMRNASALR